MRLARRLILALVVGIALVMIANAYLRLKAESQAMDADSVRDLRMLGRGLGTAVEVLWRGEGEERARRFVRDVNQVRDEVEIRWISLEDLEAREILSRLEPKQRSAFFDLGREVHFERDDEHGDPRRYSYTPIIVGNGRPVAAVEISESRAAEDEFLRSSQRIVLATAIGVVIVCSLIAIAVGVWFVGRPMRLLADKARRVGTGDLSGPLVLRQNDEIGELATEINAMCDRLAEAKRAAAEAAEARIAAIEQLRHADRLKTVGQLASGVAHELGTPLNVVSGHARMVASGELSAPEAKRSAAVIAEQADRMTEIIRQLLDFARRRTAQTEMIDLADVTARTIHMLSPLADRARVAIRLERPNTPVPIDAHGGQIRQALTNLVMNAVQAMPDGGEVVVRVAIGRPRPGRGRPDGDLAIIEVADRGVGISPAHLPHIFEPFFTTKDVGEGSGLGLAVAYGIIQDHGGWIDVDSRPGEGARFFVYLALADGARRGITGWSSQPVAS
jgi:two-component system NtrC family sensor kinase